VTRRAFGSVRKLASGRWQARYRAPEGDQITAPTTFRSRVDASRFLAEVETEMEAEAWRDPRRGAVTLRTYSSTWLAERTVRGRPLARRTLDTYQNSLSRWLLPELGDVELRQLTAPRIRQWHAAISERTGPTATRQAYALLHAILNTAVDDELLRRNPCRMRGAGQPVMKERPLLDLDQVQLLRLAMPEHLQDLVAVTFWAHLRIGEVVALQRGDFDPERRALRIERQQIELRGGGSQLTAPKAGSRRRTHLPDPAVEAIENQLRRLGPGLPTARLFVRPDGTPLRVGHIQHAWRQAARGVGLDGVHFHDLRHAGLTLSAQSGATLAEVMRRAGHASSRAALLYQHAADARDAEVADLLSQLTKKPR
jgi:integrase